jgi:arabinan endo-1,5-alpha-L-arabinosidase
MAIAAFVGLVGMASPATYAQLSGNVAAHDPSTLIKEGSTYYYFATGQGITVHTSTDRVNWSLGSSVFSTPPAWTTTAVPGYTGSAWAPDIAYFNGLYHLYYSVSTWGTIDSAIGMATSPTLANAVWTDHGKVIQSDAAGSTQPQTDTTLYNAIDPSVMVDNSTGRVWMSWGSYSSGVVVTELDPATGKRLNNSTLVATKVANNAAGGGWGSSIEASAIVKRGGFYYLFVNYGECCQGVDSTYNVRVGRSTSPTGPFVDKNGIDLRNGGGSMFLDDDGRMIGPGHFSLYTEGGQDQFGYHYYNGNANGAPTYNLHNLYWTADAWPSYAAVNSDWNGATSSGWATAANWAGGVIPNGVGQIASFDANTASRYTVGLDGAGRTLGSINFRNNGSYTIGTAAGPAITLDANADANQIATVNVAAGNHTIAAPIAAVDALAVNVSTNSTLTLGAAVTAPSLTKYGRGALSLSGTNTYNGNLLARWGTIDITGSVATSGWTSIGTIANESATLTVRGTATYVAGSDVNVGDTGDAFTPATGTLNLADNASLTVNSGGGFFVGSGYFANTRSDGTVNQSGGTLTTNGNFDGAFIIGGRGSAAAVGTYNLSGGVVNANTNLRVGGYGTGTVNQTGGTFNANGYASVGRFNGSTGTWDLSGGTLNQTAANLIIGESGRGTLNVSGTGSLVAANALRIG